MSTLTPTYYPWKLHPVRAQKACFLVQARSYPVQGHRILQDSQEQIGEHMFRQIDQFRKMLPEGLERSYS